MKQLYMMVNMEPDGKAFKDEYIEEILETAWDFLFGENDRCSWAKYHLESKEDGKHILLGQTSIDCVDTERARAMENALKAMLSKPDKYGIGARGEALATHALNFQGGMEWHVQRHSIMEDEDAS